MNCVCTNKKIIQRKEKKGDTKKEEGIRFHEAQERFNRASSTPFQKIKTLIMWVLGGGSNKHCEYGASGSSLLSGASPLETSEVGPLLALGTSHSAQVTPKTTRAGGDHENTSMVRKTN